MPFSKRHLTWNEEVFAGIIILALMLVVAGAWFTMHREKTTVAPPASTPAKPWSEMSKEEKLELMAKTPQPENAMSPSAQLDFLNSL